MRAWSVSPLCSVRTVFSALPPLFAVCFWPNTARVSPFVPRRRLRLLLIDEKPCVPPQMVETIAEPPILHALSQVEPSPPADERTGVPSVPKNNFPTKSCYNQQVRGLLSRQPCFRRSRTPRLTTTIRWQATAPRPRGRFTAPWGYRSAFAAWRRRSNSPRCRHLFKSSEKTASTW